MSATTFVLTTVRRSAVRAHGLPVRAVGGACTGSTSPWSAPHRSPSLCNPNQHENLSDALLRFGELDPPLAHQHRRPCRLLVPRLMLCHPDARGASADDEDSRLVRLPRRRPPCPCAVAGSAQPSCPIVPLVGGVAHEVVDERHRDLQIVDQMDLGQAAVHVLERGLHVRVDDLAGRHDRDVRSRE